MSLGYWGFLKTTRAPLWGLGYPQIYSQQEILKGFVCLKPV